MRSDVTLYIVAAFFFALTIASAVIFQEAERSLWIISTAVIGVLSVGLGYYQRPKAKSSTQKMAVSTVASVPAEETVQLAPVKDQTPIEPEPVAESVPAEAVQAVKLPVETAAANVEVSVSSAIQEQSSTEIVQTEAAPAIVGQQAASPLTSVKGIGEKRAAQLYSLGIKNVEELAAASVDDVALQLKVSPKIVYKWVEAAKEK
ncbi:MAG: helix-hairpin-helix domain-containing protein [Candidatus Bathyarchaeia archaeon]|jgi:predicted flap endonuclease-1-like 5' DNA nuclease